MECEQMGDRAVPDDNNQRLANEHGTRTALLLHQRTRFVRREARTDCESRSYLGGFLPRTGATDLGDATVPGYERQDGGAVGTRRSECTCCEVGSARR